MKYCIKQKDVQETAREQPPLYRYQLGKFFGMYFLILIQLHLSSSVIRIQYIINS